MEELIKNRVVCEIKTVDEIIERMKKETNGFIIPEYQRDYVWNEKNIPSLLLSLFKGYPIGSMLLQQTVTGKVKLLDGLQRTFSLVKIKTNPLIYISKDMIEHFFKNNSEYDYETNSIDNAWENIKKTINEYKKMGEILSKNRLIGPLNDGVTKSILEVFLNSFNEWIEYDMGEIKIPQIKLTSNVSDIEAAEIFELINSKGKKLTNYEILSSYWSNFPVNTNGITFIENFINSRINNFLEEIDSKDKTKIEMDNKNVSPANFIYAVFNEAINNNLSLKYVYYNGDILRVKAIDSIVTIFANILEIKNLKSKNLKEIGSKLASKVKNENDVNDMVKLLSDSMSLLSECLGLFNFISSNGKTQNIFNNMGISIALVTSFLNHIIERLKNGSEFEVTVDGKYFLKWLFIETINGEYKTSSNNNGWVNFMDGKYFKKPNDNLLDLIQKYIDKEIKDTTIKKNISSTTILIISMIQYKFSKQEGIELDLDHIIPKSHFNSRNCRKNYINTIGNLQLLSSKINREEKRNTISTRSKQWDFIFKSENINISEDFERKYEFLLNEMRKSYYKLDENNCIKFKKHTIGNKRIELPEVKKIKNDSLFIEFYELRLEIINKLIKETFREI